MCPEIADPKETRGHAEQTGVREHFHEDLRVYPVHYV